jgi:hypothetical protein
MEENIPETNPIYLEYGDVIKIYASSNKELHQQTFFIKYIDSSSRISLINTSTLHPYTLYYNEDGSGKLRDESVEEIHIIWKSPLKGYTAQNELTLHKWVDIYFGGDFPVVFTGEITEIQEDQIELTIYPSLEVIYIDFEYKGLPEYIEKIVIREKPKNVEHPLEEPEKITDMENEIIHPTNELIIDIPEDYEEEINIKKVLHNMYIDANDIIFDTGDVEIVNQIVELDSKKRIYSLDEQITNLADELLSSIPNNARTKSVMDNIQRIITKFKYLRKEFSKTDEYGNIESSLVLGLKDKPLVNKIQALSSKLRWIIPIVSLNKTLYSEEENNEETTIENLEEKRGERDEIEESQKDIPITNLVDNLKEIEKVQTDYFKNTNNEGVISKYAKLIKFTDKYNLPYSNIDPPNETIINVSQVNTDIEAIIDNLQEFNTIVYKKSIINLQKYVIQKYNLGSSMNSIEGKKQAKRNQITPNETIHIKSLLMMPEELVRFSKIDLQGTNILTQSNYAQHFPMTYKIFNRNLDNNIERIAINVDNEKDKNTDIDYEKIEKETNVPFLSNFKDFTIEYENKENNEDNNQRVESKYKTFLQKIVPDTYNLISLVQKYVSKNQINGFSFLEMVRLLEPFAIYPKNITYNAYVRIRYFIKQLMIEWKTQQGEKQREYRLIREKKWVMDEFGTENNNISQPFIELFKQNNVLQNEYYSTYKNAFSKFIQRGVGQPQEGSRGSNIIFYDELGDHILSPQVTGLKTSEILKIILGLDYGISATSMIRLLMSSLTIPDKLIVGIEGLNKNNAELSADELEKIKPDSCFRRFLSKRYTSLRDLQNDNHKEIYYDKEFDKTPYDFLTKELKSKKEQMPLNVFLEYFAEVIVQKFSVPRNLSLELANTIIKGKKTVLDGEYAILETYPIISIKKNRQLMEENETPENETPENETPENEKPEIKTTYYIRSRNIWKKDDTIDSDSIFMDNNTLFCNLSNNCVKKTKTDICEETEEARRKILAKTRETLFKEFDERFEESFDSLKEKLEKQMKNNIIQCKKIERMENIQLFKENKYAFDLGTINKKTDGDGISHSKWEYLLEQILSQPDFIKKQKDILTFADKFTREPMVENLGDSPYWYYCKETNLKLLPMYIYELAKAYIVGGSDEYEIKLKEVVRKYGTKSEDGDSIVDGIGGSGRVIQKIDFVEEELFNEAGFKINTKSVIEKDIDNIVQETITSAQILTKSNKKERIFENETNETIFNVLTTLCRNIGISSDGIENDVLRISSETVELVVVNEKKYKEKMKKVEKPKPYIQYKNQNIILIVAFVTLVAIQSATPSLQPSNTVAGCVFSFAGYPFEGGEDGNTDGLRYMACVLNISKSSIGVWASIQSIKNPVQTFMDAIIKSIAKHVIERADVIDMFEKKRSYLILNPESVKFDEVNLKKYAIQKWTTFIPPLIPYTVINKLMETSPLSDTFLQGLKKSLKKASSLQWNEIGILKTKIIQYTYGIIEYINEIVKKNEPILNTVNLTPFLQNSCCNDIGDGRKINQTTLKYFANKESNIGRYVEIALKLSISLGLNDALSLAHIFVHAIDTMRKTTIIPTNGHSMENIYQSFIYYCKFDNEPAPIPEHLKGFVTSKPLSDYNPYWSILEKMQYLKENGKNYSIADLDRLMVLVNNHNSIKVVNETIIESSPLLPVQIPNVDAMLEYLNYLDDATIITSGIIEDPLKKHLRSVLTKYKPNTMSVSDSEELGTLKNYLIYSNTRMIESIYQFFDEYRGNIDIKRLESAKIFIRDFIIWEDDNDERMATMVKYTKNVIHEMAVIFPTMIQTNKPILKTIPPHWDLSIFHKGDVGKFIEAYYTPIMKFMGDDSINELLNQTVDSLKILMGFVNYIPVINSFQKTGIDEKGVKKQYAFYSVFDKETIYLLFRYLFNSVIYEYLQKSNDPSVIKVDVVNIRNSKRKNINRNKDTTEETKGVDDFTNISDQYNDELARLNDIQIQMGNLENIKKKTVELLIDFLSIEEETKKSINKSYKTVSERVIRSKLDEKKTITDYFKNMSNDERKLEYTLKQLKMGRWNIGMQKGVFQYDKGVYDKEHKEIVDMLNESGAEQSALNDFVINFNEKNIDIMDLEKDAQNTINEEYDNEEYGIQHLGENYTDGNYYGEEEDGVDDRDFNDN